MSQSTPWQMVIGWAYAIVESWNGKLDRMITKLSERSEYSVMPGLSRWCKQTPYRIWNRTRYHIIDPLMLYILSVNQTNPASILEFAQMVMGSQLYRGQHQPLKEDVNIHQDEVAANFIRSGKCRISIGYLVDKPDLSLNEIASWI